MNVGPVPSAHEWVKFEKKLRIFLNVSYWILDAFFPGSNERIIMLTATAIPQSSLVGCGPRLGRESVPKPTFSWFARNFSPSYLLLLTVDLSLDQKLSNIAR